MVRGRTCATAQYVSLSQSCTQESTLYPWIQKAGYLERGSCYAGRAQGTEGFRALFIMQGMLLCCTEGWYRTHPAVFGFTFV